MLPKFLTKRKIAFLIFFSLVASFLSPKSTQAFYTPNSTYQFRFDEAVYGRRDEMNLQSFVYETMKATVGSVWTTIFGCLSCPGGEGGVGMIGTISTLIASVYANPPASGIEYLADIGRRLDLVQPAYAQGTGFQKMIPFMSIWKTFRDISYIFFVLIFVIAGFAIMFRVKISPQAVITIQSALPRLIIALILVTFSYAIVGFLIDLMFIIVNLIIVTFKGLPDIPGPIKFLIPNPPFISGTKIGYVILVVGLAPIIAAFLIIMAVPLLVLVGAALFTEGAAIPVIGTIDIIILVVLAIIFLIALIRVLITLIKAYINVVMALIFAPFQILAGALPGSNAITSWFRSLLANLAVLPVVLTMVFLSGYITLKALLQIPGLGGTLIEFLTGHKDASSTLKVIQAVITGVAPTIIFSVLILFLVSIGILFMAPKAAEIIQSFISGRPFGYGTALGEAFGPARTAGLFGVQYAARGVDLRYEAMREAGETPGIGLRVQKAISDALKARGVTRS